MPFNASVTLNVGTRAEAIKSGQVIQANAQNLKQAIVEKLSVSTNSLKRTTTPTPKALMSVIAATEKYEKMHENTAKDLGDGITENLEILAARVDKNYGAEPSSKVEAKMTKEEIKAFDELVQSLIEDKSIPAKNKDQAVALLLSKAVETALDSKSVQYNQLATFARLLEFLDTKAADTEAGGGLEKLSTWKGNSKYSHYISTAAEGEKPVKSDNPLHAIQTVMERVNNDLEANQKISHATARDMSALTTIIASMFNDEVKAEAKTQNLEKRGDGKFNEYRPEFSLKHPIKSLVSAFQFLTQNSHSSYQKAVENGDSGKYPASSFGPSMTAFRTVRFIELVLGGTRQEQAIYAATQGNDWDVNSSGVGKYVTELSKGKLGGAHSVFEALMTKANAVGFEADYNQTRNILMRLIADMNVALVEGEVVMTPKETALLATADFKDTEEA